MNHVNDPSDLIGIARQISLHAFTFDLARYVIAASLIAAVVWLLRRTRWASRKIQARNATAADVRREIAASISTVLVYTVMSIGVVWAVRNGYLQDVPGSRGLWTDLGLLGAILIVHDAYFYWAHRAMHHPRLFRAFHQFHHRTITPTPWAAYSFALPEAAVMAAFMPLWMWVVPTPGTTLFAFLAIMILRNCMQHAGLELHPRGWASHPLLQWISTTTHHDLHHCGSYRHNFGFYFTYWDRLMGTEHSRYVETFDRVTTPATIAAPPQMVPAE
jgi:sterol desaturase/sphingolipid hydroxylase (fatty acid hydroxylase superfamily)